jgi:hypothetical protein
MKRKKAHKVKPAPAKRAAKKPIKTKSRTSSRSVTKKTKATAQKPASKTALPDALDALIAASARELRLPLEPAWRPGVKFNLNLILRIAALVDEFPLPDDAEPGPVFHA